MKAFIALVAVLAIVQTGEAYRRYSSERGLSKLRSIALSSASRARAAVSNQHAAGQQAAFIVQHNLAQEADQAAATAHAALTGKEYAYSGLERHVEDTHTKLEAEVRQEETAERSAIAAREAAEVAEEQVESLIENLRLARLSAETARVAAEEAATELASQARMVTRARESYRAAQAKLRSAQVDYHATREAAERASAAAHEAREYSSLQSGGWSTGVEEGLGYDGGVYAVHY